MACRLGRALLFIMLAILPLPGPSLSAQTVQAGREAQPGAPAAAAALDYSLQVDAQGKPVFTQVIRWESVAGALEYELRLRADDGHELLRERLAESCKEVQLAAGRYEYRITTYNLLGKAEAETDWIGFDIMKAFQPVLLACSPRTIYLESQERRLTLSGSMLLGSGVTVLLAKDGALRKGTIVQQRNESEVVVQFPEDAYQPGEYSLVFENPGGLSTRLENSLVVRPPSILPEFWISGSGAVSLGLGALADWGPSAFGGGCGLEIDRVLFERMSLGLDVDYLDYLPANADILSMRQVGLVFSAAYRIKINSRWTASPRLGAGYGAGFVSDTMGDLSGGQFFLVARGEASWLLLPLWRIKAALGYRATIEKGAWFSALGLGISLSYQIPLKVERSWLFR